MRAVVAQSVERRLGKAEVGGSIPLGSFIWGFQEIRLLKVFLHVEIWQVFHREKVVK